MDDSVNVISKVRYELMTSILVYYNTSQRQQLLKENVISAFPIKNSTSPV